MRCWSARTFSCRDHPREYGENQRKNVEIESYKGSSPRIRGECSSVPLTCGICADHPREYGENYVRGGICGDFPGSSPRIRGEYLKASLNTTVWRIIPANTGRILECVDVTSRLGDHPREYGENASILPLDRRREGSSPRIRGELISRTMRGRM